MKEQDPYMEAQTVIDSIVECVAVNQISGEGLNCALLSMLTTSMRASGNFEHGLNDEDGVCILHVKLYE